VTVIEGCAATQPRARFLNIDPVSRKGKEYMPIERRRLRNAGKWFKALA